MTHPTSVRDMLCDLVCGMLANGSLVLLSAPNVEVARLRLSNPAFAPASDGTATANEIVFDNAPGGIVSRASLRQASDNEVLRCTVTVNGAGGYLQLTKLASASASTALSYSAAP